MFRNLIVGLALSAAFALPLANTAEAAIGDGVAASHVDSQLLPVEKAQFVFGGHNYCWYDNGWRGPGFYWCGSAFRSGFGWGGGVGWNGWSSAGWRGGVWHGGGRPGHRPGRPGHRPGHGGGGGGGHRPGHGGGGGHRPGHGGGGGGGHRPGHGGGGGPRPGPGGG